MEKEKFFDFKHFRGDFFGGITAGIVALPLALAFGVGSGLGPDAGLYGAIFISFFAALFGGTNTQISGPTAPMTAFSMLIISDIIAANGGSVEAALPAILAVFFLSGVIQVVLGIIGVGKYIRYMPYPVVSGFMTAIGVIILVTQIAPAVGYYPKEDKAFVQKFEQQGEEIAINEILKNKKGKETLTVEGFQAAAAENKVISQETIDEKAAILAGKEAGGVLGTIKILPRALSNIKWLELLLVLATVFIIYGFKRITTAIPSTLVALLVVSGVAYFANLPYISIKEIPDGFPVFQVGLFTNFSLSALIPYVGAAFTLALLGAIDSLLTSIVADNMTKTKHKPNRELIGQGIGNSIASMFGGIPGAGATIRTVVNINSGGKTRLSGMIAGVLLLIILLALSKVASQIPAAVLAGILVTVGIGVMDYKGLKAIPYMPKDMKVGPFKLSSEVIIMMIVLILSSVWNLVYAVGVGLVIALWMFMKKTGDLTAEKSDVKPLKEEAWDDEVGFPKELNEEVFIKHIKGPLFFGSTSDFQALSKQIPSTATAVVIRMDKMAYMDQSGLYTMEDILIDLRKQDIKVLLVDVQKQPRYMMERVDMIPDLIPEEHIFDNFDDCMNWTKDNVKDVVTGLPDDYYEKS